MLIFGEKMLFGERRYSLILSHPHFPFNPPPLSILFRLKFGNMAVSNAFGSNTFNIMVGLGLPWLLYTANGVTYSDLRDDGVTEMVIILGSVLLAFVIFILMSGFMLYRWHAWVFFAMYAGYVVYTVAQVYLRGMGN